MTLDLQHLIAEAQGLAMDHPCGREHAWKSIGGRHCSDCGGSKAVFECARCGDCDYGDREACGRECDRAKLLWNDDVDQAEAASERGGLVTEATPHGAEG